MDEITTIENGFIVGAGGDSPLAKILFHREPGPVIVIDSTTVAESLRGRGIGSRLVDRVAALARTEHARIRPNCPFARKILFANPGYKDTLLTDAEYSKFIPEV
jgi:uncharacterized protein